MARLPPEPSVVLRCFNDSAIVSESVLRLDCELATAKRFLVAELHLLPKFALLIRQAISQRRLVVTENLLSAQRIRRLVAVVILLGVSARFVTSEDRPSDAGPAKAIFEANIPMKTLGGRQFWGDVHFFRGWTIQRNVFTGHHRLLDPRDVRHAWGSHDKCRACLDRIRQEKGLSPMSGEAVILLHGIFRSSKAMSRVQQRLEKDGHLVVPFDYPSTRADIRAAAEMLGDVIRSLEGVEKISFVTHSMGGLVVRAWLGDGGDPRANRLVMMGTPNSGSEVADLLRDWHLYRLILGPAGQQLITPEDSLIGTLPVPDIPFAVIAGGKGTGTGFNPVIPGDDDGLVAVSSAHLSGAEDSITLPVMHSFLPYSAEAIEAAVRYLSGGALRQSGERVPVPPADGIETSQLPVQTKSDR